MELGWFIEHAHWSPLHLLIPVMILFRLLELRSAKRNHEQLVARGAVEIGANHYPAFVVLHVLWFVGMIVEVLFLTRPINPFWPALLPIFIGARLLRFTAMRALADRWSTRIMVLPGAQPVSTGPYRYLRHPIYVAVVAELISLPLIFSAYVTAITIALLNAILLRIRIRAEEKALREIGRNYESVSAGQVSAGGRRGG
jgi:methyltransferase